MNATLHASRAYAAVQAHTDVEGADPHRLVLLMLEAALAAVRRAAERMRARDVATKGAAIGRAIQILEEGLIASLDERAGGELAGRLKDLYAYMTRRLLLASMRNDPEGCDEVARLLGEIRDAWAAIGAAEGAGG